MQIDGLVKCLKKMPGLSQDDDVANYLGIAPRTLKSWTKENHTLDEPRLVKLLGKSRKAAKKEAQKGREEDIKKIYRHAIKPIVEFYPIKRTDSRQGANYELLPTGRNAPLQAKSLYTILKKAVGIYIFYDPRGRALYTGMTKNELWGEMKLRYNKKKRGLPG